MVSTFQGTLMPMQVLTDRVIGRKDGSHSEVGGIVQADY